MESDIYALFDGYACVIVIEWIESAGALGLWSIERLNVALASFPFRLQWLAAVRKFVQTKCSRWHTRSSREI